MKERVFSKSNKCRKKHIKRNFRIKRFNYL